MTNLNDFLNIISEGKKQTEEKPKELSIFDKTDFSSFVSLVENEYVKEKEIQNSIPENVDFSSFLSLFGEESTSNQLIEETIHTEPEIITELIEPVEIIEKSIDLTDPTKYDHLFKTNVDLFNQPNLPKVSPDIKAVTEKLQYMENWLTKISMAGSGSGEVNFRYLDDVDRSTIGNTDQILRYNPSSKKFFFGNLTGDQGSVNSLNFNTSGTSITPSTGTLAWNSVEDCLDIYHSDGTVLQTGLEQYIQIHNHTGAIIPNGSVVKFVGVQDGGNPLPIIDYFTANTTTEPFHLIGVTTSDIAIGATGRATTLGKVRTLNTTGSSVGETWVQGDILWAHPTNPGKLTKVRPTAPDLSISIAAVLSVDANNGVLLVRPTIIPRLSYGSWYSTQQQNQTQINTPKEITLSNTAFTSGFTLANSNTIVAQTAGLYNFQFSVQVESGTSASAIFWIWYRKNGQDVPNTATKLTIKSNSDVLAPAWNFVESLKIGETFQLMWAVDNIQVFLSAPPASAFCPAIPSVILSVTQVNN